MPAYRLAAVIGENISRVSGFLRPTGLHYEIVPVDDGSDDGTAEVLAQAAAADPEHVHPVILPRNVGKGLALKSGFEASTGDYVLLLDGDLDLSPQLIPVFFNVLHARLAEIVIGSKRHPASRIDYPLRRRLASWCYSALVRLLIGLPLTDTQSGMKLFRRDALQWAFERMLVKRFAFDVEILSIAKNRGYRIAEAPIEMNFGEKTGCLSVRNVRDVLVDTLAICYRQRVLRYYRNVLAVKMPEPPPRVSVVIACPGDSAYLRESLAALAKQTYRAFEVIVLPDAPIENLPAHDLDLRVLPTGKVRPAEKRNAGVAAATGSIIAFLDDDAYPVPEWLEKAVRYFSLPDVGGVGGPGVTPPGDPWLARMSGRVFASPLVSGGFRYRYLGDRVRANVDDFPSCNLFFRKDAFDAVGGFNTRFWPGEDTLLCRDIVVGRGLRIVYDPFAVVYHHRRKLFLPHLRQVGRYGLHRGYFAKRFPETSRRLSYMLPSICAIGALVAAVGAFFHPAFLWTLVGAGALYAAITLLGSFSFRPHVWLVTWLGVMLTHFWYGVRFLWGIAARRMPCEVAQFDHGPTDSGKGETK